MNLTNYLRKRPNSSRWQFRWMVPVAARAAVGRSEFTKSLGVADRKTAANLALPILLQWKERVEAAMRGNANRAPNDLLIIPTAIELEEVAVHIGFEEASRRAESKSREKASSASDFEAWRETLERWHRDSIRRMRAGDHSYWEERARRAVQRLGWHLPDGSPQFRTFAEQIGRAGIDTFARALVSMSTGDDARFVPSTFVAEARRRRSARATPGERIVELFDRYAVQRLAEGRKRPEGIEQVRVVVTLFAEFAGADRSLKSIV